MANEITINASRATRKITVNLVGERYEVRPPKKMSLVNDMRFSGDSMEEQAEAIRKLIHRVFGDQSDEIFDRLEDEDDALDLEHIMELVDKMYEKKTGNPTT